MGAESVDIGKQSQERFCPRNIADVKFAVLVAIRTAQIAKLRQFYDKDKFTQFTGALF
jgi:hypothetical protein